MDSEIRAEFDEIRALLAQSAAQVTDTNRSLDDIRGLVASIAQQQAYNTVAISQLTRSLEQTRQAIAEQNRQIQDSRGDIALHAAEPNAHQDSGE